MKKKFFSILLAGLMVSSFVSYDVQAFEKPHFDYQIRDIDEGGGFCNYWRTYS